eukprot:2217374-Amphidinium_carterae.1
MEVVATRILTHPTETPRGSLNSLKGWTLQLLDKLMTKQLGKHSFLNGVSQSAWNYRRGDPCPGMNEQESGSH